MIPDVDTLEVIAEPDDGPTEDFVVSVALAKRQAGRRAGQSQDRP